MASFTQWYSARVNGKACADWVYAGGEAPLVAEVEAYVRRPGRFGTTPLLVDSVDGKGLTWPDLHRKLQSSTLHRAFHLLIIRNGHLVVPAVWDDLLRWRRSTDAAIVKTRLIFVSAAERYNARDKKDPRYLAFALNKFGQHVDCHLPVERQPKYAGLKLGADRARVNIEAVADLVVQRCGGDLNRLKSECEKLLVFCGDSPVTVSAVEAVTTPSPGELFVEALLRNNRAEASARAPYVGSVRFVLGSLDYSLQALYLIRLAKNQSRTAKRMSTMRIAEVTGLPYFVVARLEKLAVTYDLTTVRRRAFALVQASFVSTKVNKPEWVLQPLVAVW